MTSVIIGIESDKVAVQNAQKKLITQRQDTVDFTARERSIQEEPDLNILIAAPKFPTQHFRQ